MKSVNINGENIDNFFKMVTSVIEIKNYLTDIYVYVLEMKKIVSDSVSHYFTQSIKILATEMEYIEKNNSVSENFILNLETVIGFINRVDEVTKDIKNPKFIEIYINYFSCMIKLLELLEIKNLKVAPLFFKQNFDEVLQ